MSKLIQSGAKNQAPGLYRESDAQGNSIPNGRIITLRAGCELPSTHHGSGWVQVKEQ